MLNEATLAPWLGNYPSAKTREAYTRDATLWDQWCRAHHVDVLHPLSGHITSWMQHRREQGDSESTVMRRISAVLTFYKWARHEGVTDANPEPFKRPKVSKDDVDILGLDRDQFLNVCKHAGGARNLAFVSLLGYCGLRISEALDADLDAIREQSGHRVIRVVGKGNRPRTVPVVAKAYTAVREYTGARHSGPIFLTRNGNRWQRRDAWECVEAIGRRAGMPGLHPHMLRHTAATLMLEAGAPLDRVQKVLGHASPATTMRYAQARDRLDGSPVYDLARYLAED